MVVINKPHIAAFGVAVFGQAVLAIDFHTQNIPSPLFDPAQNVGAVSNSGGTISGHYPWHIEQPGTLSQKEVWAIFLQACDCFAHQPLAGGVVPPAIGPRNRSWWYDNDPGVPPIYYNYFMQETLTSLFAGVVPDWCKNVITEDSYVSTPLPDSNHGEDFETEVAVHKEGDFEKVSRIWIKTPGVGSKKLHLYCSLFHVRGGIVRVIEVCNQWPEEWDEDTITWNNQPLVGERIAFFSSSWLSTGEWHEIDIKDANSVCIKFFDESIPADGKTISAAFESKESGDIDKRPYVSLI